MIADVGSASITREKNGLVTIMVRSAGSMAESKITLSASDFGKLVGLPDLGLRAKILKISEDVISTREHVTSFNALGFYDILIRKIRRAALSATTADKAGGVS